MTHIEESLAIGEFEMTIEEVREIIKRHIAGLDGCIKDQQARIRETYDAGIHTNVDPMRAAIERYEQRKMALEIILDEISEK